MYYQNFKEYYEEDRVSCLHFQCVGNQFSSRKDVLNSYLSSISNMFDYNNNNSYLMFETGYTTGIAIMCGGEIFGTIGFVDKEHEKEILDILQNCTEYRVDLVNDKDVGKDVIEMDLFYTE